MFATKRGLSDACNTIAKQLENVYSSVAATKRHLSSRIDRVDCSLDECAELTAATREEVSELRGEMKGVGVDVQSVHHAVRTLETKISRIEGKQDAPSSTSRPALEMAHATPLSRIESLPPIPSDELPSPSTSYGSQKRPLQNAGSGSGLKELHGISDVVDALTSPDISNGVHATTQDKNNGNSGYGLFGRSLSGFSASFLTRTRSAVQSFK
ncbi:bZIP transcription factor, putative [Actinidia rufa]|uniref:BZIP transcription factor, putative n=1 Tax=Actinidia rufa TaxID=165716 RepID=A0A7J0HDQ9_9ERIC|nr:bZIP transcription factor, putative [Actinidia rufa]